MDEEMLCGKVQKGNRGASIQRVCTENRKLNLLHNVITPIVLFVERKKKNERAKETQNQ